MICRKLSITAILVLGLDLLPSGMARANLVTNGGFEFFTGTAPKDFIANVLPTDWSGGSYTFVDAPGTAVTAPGIEVYGPFPATSPDGGNFIESDGSSGLRYPISQTISGLTAGQSYNVSFYQAAGQQLGDSGPTTEQWQVTLDSSTQFSALMSIPQGGVSPWEPQTLTLTADSTSDVLSFLAIGGGGGVPPIVFLDGVDMESSVPEPSAVLLLAGIGVSIGIVKIRRRMLANRTDGSR
jgi:hypothetical protein